MIFMVVKLYSLRLKNSRFVKYRLCSCRCFWTGWTNLVASTCAGNGYTSVVIRGRTSAAQLIFSLQLHPQSFRVSVVARRRPTFNLKASVLPRRMKRSFFLEIFRETAEISASKRSAILHQWNDRKITSTTGIISFPRREIFFHIWHEMQKKLEANKIFDVRRNIVISLIFVEDFWKLNFIDYYEVQ